MTLGLNSDRLGVGKGTLSQRMRMEQREEDEHRIKR